MICLFSFCISGGPPSEGALLDVGVISLALGVFAAALGVASPLSEALARIVSSRCVLRAAERTLETQQARWA